MGKETPLDGATEIQQSYGELRDGVGHLAFGRRFPGTFSWIPIAQMSMSCFYGLLKDETSLEVLYERYGVPIYSGMPLG